MPNYWPAHVSPNQSANLPAAVAYASSSSLTDVSPGAASNGAFVIPANSLTIGSTITVEALAKFSNTGTPTLLLGVYYGGIAGTKLAATGATTTTTAATNWPVRLKYVGTVQSLGTSGTIVGGGYVMLATSLTAFSLIPIDAAATAAVTIDTTAAKAVTLGAQWGTLSASNTLTVMNYVVTVTNPA